jgi:hypothetical protein
MLLTGTGVPVKKNLDPMVPGKIGDIAGQTLPSLGLDKGFDPVKPVEPPLEAKNA